MLKEWLISQEEFFNSGLLTFCKMFFVTFLSKCDNNLAGEWSFSVLQTLQ